MKIIFRYILKEIVPLFIVSNLFIIFILLFEKLIDLASLFFAKGVPGTLIIQTIIYYIPSFLVISIPISTLISAMTAFSRFSADSELIVMKASGISSFWFLKKMVLIGFVFFILGLTFSLWLMPLGNRLSIDNLKKIANNISISDIKENELYEDIPGFVLLIGKKNDKYSFENITIIQKNKNILVTAKKGVIFPTKNGSINFDLQNGEIVRKNKNNFTKIEFGKFSLNFNTNINETIKVKDERIMPIKALIANLDKSYIYKFELSKRFSLPFSCVIMAVFGMILGSFFVRGGKSINLFAAIAVVFTYNMVLVFSENLAKISFPALSAWYANILFAVLCVIFYKRSRV